MTKSTNSTQAADTIDTRWGVQFKDWFATISNLDLGVLIRVNNPEYNFQDIKPQLEMAVASFGELSQNYDFWSSLPERKQREIESHISQLISSIDAIKSFDAKQNNAWQQRANLVSNFTSSYDQFYGSTVESLYAYLGMRAYSQDLTRNFSKQAKEQLDEISAAKMKIDEIQRSVEDAAQVASSTASTATAHFFDDEFTRHSSSATKWLWIVWGIILIFGVIVGLFVYEIVKSTPQAASINSLSPTDISIKLVIIGTILLALRFATKNYNASKHLTVTNKHRANVLKTIEAYRQSASSETTKDAVLAAGVSVAFSSSETGYISTKEGAGSGDDSVAELTSLLKAR